MVCYAAGQGYDDERRTFVCDVLEVWGLEPHLIARRQQQQAAAAAKPASGMGGTAVRYAVDRR
jgi:hypothetical protein